jgi:hypothetical protein
MSVRLGSPRIWRIVLSVLALLSFAAAIPLSLLSHQAANLVIAAVIGLPSAGIGVLVTRRQPGNPLGWLFLVSAVCQFIGTDGGGYALLAYQFGHHLPLASVALALDQIWGPSLVVFAVSILLFPDGRLPRFWRWVFRVYCVVFATLLIATAVAIAGALAAHPVRVDESGGLAAVDHPVGWFNAVQGVILVLIFGLSLSFIVRQALSWRRANGERRQQLKWLASGAFVTVVCLSVAGTVGSSSNSDGPTLLGVLGVLAWMCVTALPVSIGVGILKYRLYEIDRIISRTLAYAIVTGLLVGLYAGLVLLATEVLRFSSPVAVAASTLVAAALFNPVRRRVQHGVDRRFNRARYDAERMVKTFAARLQDAVDPDTVRADLTGVVHTALEPTHVSVWLGK